MRAYLVGAVTLAYLAGCRSPTQIDVSVSTNVPCRHVSGTAVTTGTLGEIETIPPASTTRSCVNERIGSVVLVPSGDDGALVGFKVVTAINGGNLDDCKPGDGGSYGPNCIVARRALRYLPHTSLEVDVLMSSGCAGVTCDAQSTCVEGACVPATIGNSAQCTGNGCSETVLGAGDAGAPDATVHDDAGPPDGGRADTAPDDGATEGGAPDAPPGNDGAVPACDMRGLLAGAPWPMEGYCPSGRNRSPLVGPAKVAWKWSVALPGGGAAAASIGPDGTLYPGCGNGQVLAVEPGDGGILWTSAPFGDAGSVYSMPVLAADGTLRVFDFAGGNYAVLSLDGGSSLLTVPAPAVRGGVAIPGSGTTYVTDTTGHLDALDPAGRVIFQLPGRGWDHAFPSVAANGTIFSADGLVTLFGIVGDGGALWGTVFDAGAGPLSTPQIAPDGTLRVFSYTDTLYKLDPASGAILWQVQVSPGTGDIAGIAIADDGTTYVGLSDGLFAYASTNGKLVGSYTTHAVGEPTLDADGNVYAHLGTSQGSLASFDPSCVLRWEITIPSYPGFTADSPVLGPGGMIYTTVNDNGGVAALHAFMSVP